MSGKNEDRRCQHRRTGVEEGTDGEPYRYCSDCGHIFDSSLPDWVPCTDVPEGHHVTASLLIVGLIDQDGNASVITAAKGHAPSTTYLGLTVRAQRDIEGWGQ